MTGRWVGPSVVVGSTTLLIGLIVTFYTVELWVTSPVLLWSTSAAPIVLGALVVAGSMMTSGFRASSRRAIVGVQLGAVGFVLVSTVLLEVCGDPSIGAGLLYLASNALLLVVAVVSSILCVARSRGAVEND